MNRLKKKNTHSRRRYYCYALCIYYLTLKSLNCLTSCLLISLVENVLFWWTSSVSDHSVLFLRFVGVGPASLLPPLRSIPGDLLSARIDIDFWGGKERVYYSQTHFSIYTSTMYVFRVGGTRVWHSPGWSVQSAAQRHSLKEKSSLRGTKLWLEVGLACYWVPGNKEGEKRIYFQWIVLRYRL